MKQVEATSDSAVQGTQGRSTLGLFGSVAWFLSLGCAQPSNSQSALFYMPITEVCEGLPTDIAYFAGTFPGGNRSEGQEFAKRLVALGEPPLACGRAPEPSYRLIERAPFEEILTLRVAAIDTHGELTFATMTPGLPAPNKTHQNIAEEQWLVLKRSIAPSDVWSRPVYPLRDPPVLHGSSWYLEARDSGRYRVTIIKLEKEAPDLRATWRVLFELAHLPVPSEVSK